MKDQHFAHECRASGRTHSVTLLCCITLACLVAMTGCGNQPKPSQPAVSAPEWHEFQGTWTATGNRQLLQMGPEHRVLIANFDGALVLAGTSRPGVGFRAEAVVLSDSKTGLVGRAVWTDEHGDQAFSELRGQGTESDNRIAGTFIGGTGRYAGATGNYEFSWRFVVENEDGTVQGQSLGLTGRVRGDPSNATSGSGGPQR